MSEDPITRLPILILSPHSRCNCRCLMCDIWKDGARRELTAAEVAGWVEEWRRLGVREVVLSGGEALMHSDLFTLCRPMHEAGIAITLLSTGLLLSRHAESIAGLIDNVILSLDGPKEVHDAIRNVPRAYERLAEGAAAVRRLRPRLPLSARCTVQRKNFRFLRGTVAAAHAIDLDSISFLAVDVSSAAFNRPEGKGVTPASEMALSAAETRELEEMLTRLECENAPDFQSGFIVESPAKLRARLLQYFRALLGIEGFARISCNAPWVSAVVESDGAVRPCFFHEPLGNLRQAGSLEAVLNSSRAQAFRASLDVATNPVCVKCVCSLDLKENAAAAPKRTKHAHA
jgi:MoaA/NifB/PqqE/SkfB family radical SAM enzyme